jgi:hypothetical protein
MKIRRFVVVRVDDRAVSCHPVTSYDGAGYGQTGIHLDEHGFIYSKKASRMVEGMLSRQLKIILARGAAPLKEPYLVNYGKIYSIPTNVKVKDIGLLDSCSHDILLHYHRKVYCSEIESPRRAPSPGLTALVGVGLRPPSQLQQWNTAPDPSPSQLSQILADISSPTHSTSPEQDVVFEPNDSCDRPTDYITAGIETPEDDFGAILEKLDKTRIENLQRRKSRKDRRRR